MACQKCQPFYTKAPAAGGAEMLFPVKIFLMRKFSLDKQTLFAYNMLKLFYLNNFN